MTECRTKLSDPGALNEDTNALESFVTLGVQQAKSMNMAADVIFSVACAQNCDVPAKDSMEAQPLGERVSAKKAMSWARRRAAVRKALSGIGLEDPPELQRGAAGEPIWPEGVCGSITHCDGWSVVVATQTSCPMSLGIDMEDADRISDLEITPVVCRSSECDWIFADDNPHARLCMIFSAKEALYKSLYPWHRRYIDFTEAELSWCEDQSAFHATLFTNESDERKPLFISSQRRGNLIFSCSICQIQ